MKLKDLAHNQKNPRTITDAKLAQLKKALLKFGDLSGIVFNRQSKQLVGGHQRSKHFDDSTDVVYTKKFSKPTKTGTVAEGYVEMNGERFAYREVQWDRPTELAANIAANKGAGEWDLPELGAMLKELSHFDLDFDMDLTMHDADELQEFEGILVKEHTRVGPTGVDEDEVPEPKAPRAKLGDVYRLGSHRLMCGDSTNLKHAEKLMKGAKADLIFTDPPYGVAYEQGKFTGSTPKKKFDPIANDEKQGKDLYDFLAAIWKCAHAMTAEVSVIYSWSPPLLEGAEILKSLVDSGWHIQSQIIWDKTRLVLGRADYQWRHEICWYGYKGKNHFWCGDRDQTSIWQQKRDNAYEHPTQKPVELAERAIQNSVKETGSVLDLFGGSGSTLIACEKTNRSCYMMELAPQYVDVIIERWENYTGKKAKLVVRATDKTLKKPVKQAEEHASV